MRWRVEDGRERAAFREQCRGWLREVLPHGWLDAVDNGDDARFDEVRKSWDVGQWQRTIGASGYGAPLWPKEFGGLSGEPWMQAVVREELGRYQLPTASFNILGVGLAGPTMNERVALQGLSLDRVAFLGGTRRDPWQAFLDTVPERSAPLVRDRLAQIYIEQEIKEVTAFRAAAARAAGRPPGPEGGVGKVFNAEFNQRRTEAAVDAAGLGGVAWMPGDSVAESRAHNFLRARANR